MSKLNTKTLLVYFTNGGGHAKFTGVGDPGIPLEISTILDSLNDKKSGEFLALNDSMVINCSQIKYFQVIDYFEHCPKHKKLEAKLTRIFMEELEKSGYLSEEMELSKK